MTIEQNKKEEIKASEFGLVETQVSDVDIAFAEKIKERELISEIYGKIISKDITTEVAIEARELRLKAVKIKSGIASIHKTQKEFALAFGKYCDAWKRKETEPVQQIIDGLMEIEKYEEIQEQKRLKELQESRVSELTIYVEDACERDLSGMADDVWIAYFQTKKKDYEDRIAAEKKAELDRIAKEKAIKLRLDRKEKALPYFEFWSEFEKTLDFAEVAETDFNDFMQRNITAKTEDEKQKEKVKKENEHLLKEAKERERLAKIEAEKRAKIEADRKAKEEAERKARDEKERKERAEYEAKLKVEREAKEKIERQAKEAQEQREAEIKATEEAEQKAEKEAAEKIQHELNKDDSEKVKDLIADFEALKSKYSFKSSKNIKMYSDVGSLINKVVNHINK